jgi:hypothetical protein
MMRKAEKVELDRVNYGLSLAQCPAHHQPLVRHELNFWQALPEGCRPKGWEEDTEGCWDCSTEGCDYHVHEPPDAGEKL